MGRNVRKQIKMETFNSPQVIDLTLIANLVSLIFSMILCYLLFQAI